MMTKLMIITEGKLIKDVVAEIMERLVEQGSVCVTGENDACCYGDGENRHCAVGWLLPFDRPDLMGHEGSLLDLIEVYDDLGPNDKFIRSNAWVLGLVQSVHDTDYPHRFRDVIGDLTLMHNIPKEVFTPWVEIKGISISEEEE